MPISEVSGSNQLVAAVVPLQQKELTPHCLVPQIGLEAIGPLVAFSQLTSIAAK